MHAKPGEPTHEFIAAETRRFEVLGGQVKRLPEQQGARAFRSVGYAGDYDPEGIHIRGFHVAAEFDLYSESAA